jgi:hypothetical protein
MAYMYLSIFESRDNGATKALTIDPACLDCSFEQVTDGRKKEGKRYALPRFVTVLILGKNVASQMRHFFAHPAEALQLLCHKLLQ